VELEQLNDRSDLTARESLFEVKRIQESIQAAKPRWYLMAGGIALVVSYGVMVFVLNVNSFAHSI
jgi:hypothetical protein